MPLYDDNAELFVQLGAGFAVLGFLGINYYFLSSSEQKDSPSNDKDTTGIVIGTVAGIISFSLACRIAYEAYAFNKKRTMNNNEKTWTEIENSFEQYATNLDANFPGEMVDFFKKEIIPNLGSDHTLLIKYIHKLQNHEILDAMEVYLLKAKLLQELNLGNEFLEKLTNNQHVSSYELNMLDKLSRSPFFPVSSKHDTMISKIKINQQLSKRELKYLATELANVKIYNEKMENIKNKLILGSPLEKIEIRFLIKEIGLCCKPDVNLNIIKQKLEKENREALTDQEFSVLFGNFRDEFTDPITRALIHNPARATSSYQLFDYNSLLLAGGKHPMTQMRFSIEDIVEEKKVKLYMNQFLEKFSKTKQNNTTPFAYALFRRKIENINNYNASISSASLGANT